MSIEQYCTTCDTRLLPGDRFCAHCGAEQEQVTPSGAEESSPSVWEEVHKRLRNATAAKYDVGRELGHGGMAAVFIAEELRLKRRVAIKVMSPGLMVDPAMVQRFHQEAVTVAGLSHPNIITIHAVDETDGLHFFVMKYLPGPAINKIISNDAPLPISVVKIWLTQVASALSYAHRRGVIHRDIKPANILLDDEGNATVTDFGIAKVALGPSLTQTGMTVGTPAYMSPEQWASDEMTGAADQYSLGVVAYEMLAGEPPFTGDTLSVMRAHLEDEPRSLDVFRSDCPSQLQDVVGRMLAKDPEARWPSMDALIASLDARPLAHDDPLRMTLAAFTHARADAQSAEAQQVVTGPRPPAVSDEREPEPAHVASVEVSAAESTGRVRRFWWTAPAAAVLLLLLWAVFGRPQPAAIASVDVSPTEWSLSVGATLPLLVTLRDSDGNDLADREVSWSSNNLGVASVSDGQVTGLGPGIATITVLARGGIRGFATVTVTGGTVAAVTVVPAVVELAPSDTVTLQADPVDANGDAVEDCELLWQSDDPSVVTVSQDGLVTGVGSGSATVTVLAAGEAASAEVRVGAAVASVRVAPRNAAVTVGESVQFRATVSGAAGAQLGEQEVTWRSSNRSIATVSRSGLVTGVGTGSTTVTARSGERSARATVTVNPSVPPGDNLPAGPHMLRFEAEGHLPVEVTIEVRSGEQRDTTIRLSRRNP